MSLSRSKKINRTVVTLPFVATSSPATLHSLLDCYNFLAPHEYSEETLGILAFLLRKSVGTINFSDVIDAVEKRNQQGPSTDFIALLEDKRKDLRVADAPIEACLMLDRLITYIQEMDEKNFASIHSHIRLYMKQNLDPQLNANIQYPEDFRQREVDFLKRKNAQDMRRLFYFTHNETKGLRNLISLQNRITEHLDYLLDSNRNNSSKFGHVTTNELEKIFANSFIITDHPRNGVNPVLIYDRKGPGIYRANVSVKIVSLLHDFMQIHPNLIQLNDIELSLHPRSNLYKLDESQKLFWKTCHLQACPGSKPQTIQYAELTFITVQQTYKEDTRVHFTQALHTLKFSIKFHINLPEYGFSELQQITLESLPFAIGHYNNQIPQLLTRVLLADIRRFSLHQSTGVETVLDYILRYFTHRTGVEPRNDQKIYLQDELHKATKARKDFQNLEDIFMDFLVPYVYQVEYMAKHPILAMFYADGLFLGPCNSLQAAEVMKKPSDRELSKIGLRFNSIRVDYEAIIGIPVLHRTIELKECAVRVDIYNNRGKTIRHRTFDSSMLSNDIYEFISNSPAANLRHVRVLCNLHEDGNNQTYKSFAHFAKYWHTRLHELSNYEETYRLINDLGRNLVDGDDSGDSLFGDDDYSHDTGSSSGHQSITSVYVPTFYEEHIDDTKNVPVEMLISDDYSTGFEEPEQTVRVLFDSQERLQISYIQELAMIDEAISIPDVENATIQSENRPLLAEVSPSHSVQLHETSSHSLVVQSTPVCCTGLTGLTLTTNREYHNKQNPPTSASKFQGNFSILIVYLGKHAFTLKENSSIKSREFVNFECQFACTSRLLSEKEKKITYFIISATLAKVVIPFIHNYLWIEHIYIHQDHDSIQSVTWIDGYSKIQGTWSSLEKIAEQVKQDISLIEARPNGWSRTRDIFTGLCTQKLSTSTIPAVSDDMKQSCEIPVIVTLCGTQPIPFDLSKEGLKTYHQFSTVKDCHQFAQEQGASSIFLVIISDRDIVFDEIESLIKHHSIHASYVFCMNNSNETDYQTISTYDSPKISGIFHDEKDLLRQMVTDICFFWQIPIYTPKISILKIEIAILSKMDEDKKAFLNFQFFIDILQQLWCVPGVPSAISNGIKTAGTDSSADLYVNNAQLTLEIDRLMHQFDPASLFKASSRLRFINQQLESSVQKTYPFSITVYRAQLLSNDDLKAMEKNKNFLFTLHTFVFACRSFASTKRICRRACNNGLTAVLLEINITKNKLLTYLDSDIIIFPLSTVFKIISTTKALDGIYHVQLELANSTAELIRDDLYSTIGERLTWLNFGYYLAHIKNYEIAEKYFQYLQTISLKSQELASVHIHMNLMYLLMDNRHEEVLTCLAEARKSMELNKAEIDHTEKHSTLETEISQYEKLAELHEQIGDKTYASLFYEKALKCTTDSKLRQFYQLKIETLNVKIN